MLFLPETPFIKCVMASRSEQRKDAILRDSWVLLTVPRFLHRALYALCRNRLAIPSQFWGKGLACEAFCTVLWFFCPEYSGTSRPHSDILSSLTTTYGTAGYGSQCRR